MRTLVVAVVLVLAAGIVRAEVKTVPRTDAMVLSGMETSCAWCNDKHCKHVGAIVCPKKVIAKKITWIRTPPKHVKLLSKIPIADLNNVVAPQSKMPGGSILDARPGLSVNGPAATGTPAAPAPPTGGQILR